MNQSRFAPTRVDRVLAVAASTLVLVPAASVRSQELAFTHLDGTAEIEGAGAGAVVHPTVAASPSAIVTGSARADVVEFPERDVNRPANRSVQHSGRRPAK